MNRILTLLCAAMICGTTFAQTTSQALGGSCKNSDEGTLTVKWNALLNCTLEGDISGISTFGFHSAAEDWGVFEVLYDDPSAVTAERNSGDTVEVTVNAFDYYGIAVTDMTVLKFVLNDVMGANPWAVAGRDTVQEDGIFGLSCTDLFIDVTNLQECVMADTTGDTTITNGINSLEAVAFLDAFPNPANEEITLSFPNSTSEGFELYVSNTLGQVVHTAYITSNRAVIFRNGLPSGVYLATLQNEDGARSTVRFQFN